MRKATVIVDLQFGSTGKGLIAGYWAMRNKPDVIVTAFSPNAGHTFIDKNGRKFVHTMIPNGIVADPEYVLIGPNSIINPDNFLLELMNAQTTGISTRVFVHPLAAVVDDRHREEEKALNVIGSTQKGSGAAQVEKIMRRPSTVLAKDHPIMSGYTVEIETYRGVLEASKNLLVEGHQGYSLGLNAGFFPHCTYRDCHAAQIASDCGVPVGWIELVIGTCRPYPIRVANRFNDKGEMVGYSGPCYSDQHETMFEALGLKQEFTTVTKLPRRIFTFSRQQIKDALWANQVGAPIKIFANFVNYLPLEERLEFVEWLNRQAPVGWLGLGATENDVHTPENLEHTLSL
jgi:adenylosuccinate synthase